MSSSTGSLTVLVTGMNGFVGAHVTKAFLDHGWNVKGTVRSEQKGVALTSLPAFSKAFHEKKLQYVVVNDLVTGDFEATLKGVDALAHTASPLHFVGKAFTDYAQPAVQGTANVLSAARKCQNIKAVVVTSSMVAVVDTTIPAEQQSGRVYTENDWFPLNYEEANQHSSPIIWYCASKKLAEKKAWEIKDSGAPWSLATICPPLIFGPVLHTENPHELNESSGRMYNFFAGLTGKEVPPPLFPSLADVRDVAEAHYQAIVRSAGGRFLVSSGLYDHQRLADLIHQKFPNNSQRTPTGTPGKYYTASDVYTLDATKAQKDLGISIRSFEEVVFDTIEQYIDLEAHQK